jgi:gamma-glutamyltranspeptidase / glutathione hydrolase
VDHGVNRTAGLVAEGGMVTAQDPRAAEAGARMLAAGGNAIDAAVATALAIGVVEPCMSGIGGTAWITLLPGDGEPCVVIDGSGRAAFRATPDMFELDPEAGPAGFYGWPAVRGDANIRGGRAASYVPGAVAALCLAHERFGRLGREDVFRPAIELAADGFEVNAFLSALITLEAANLRRDPGCAATFLPDGLPLRPAGFGPADVLRQPALADTLERIARDGATAFYEGPVARSIVETLAADGGVLEEADLARYSASIVPPLARDFGDVRISVPPAGGGPSVLQALRLFEVLTRRAPGAAAAVRWAEASRLAFADRFEHMTADPEASVPWEHLLSAEHAEEAVARSEGVLETAAKSGCTSHLNVVDADGMAVSLTATILDAFGARVLDPASGVLLNDGMMWFDPRPGRPNSIRPGVPGMTAASPALLTRGGAPFAVLGATGGRGIISALPQICEGVLAGLDPQTAIDRPRVHSEGAPVKADMRLDAQELAELRASGAEVEVVEETSLTWHFARPNAIVVQPDGRRAAGLDRVKPAAAAAV